MPYRLVVHKAAGNGEQLQLDVCQWNPVTGEMLHDNEEMKKLYDDALAIADDRLHDMNTRMLEAYGLENQCEPAVWAKVVDILDVLAGRQSADTVARRWQSAKEETEELARRREEHAREHANDIQCIRCNEMRMPDMFEPTLDDPFAQTCDYCKGA